jgi:hypothetical protein
MKKQHIKVCRICWFNQVVSYVLEREPCTELQLPSRIGVGQSGLIGKKCFLSFTVVSATPTVCE